MSEPQTDALIDQLRRANGRWKALALGALAALVLAIAGLTTFTALRVGREKAAAEAARAEAEQAQQETKEARQNAVKARKHMEQMLYASQIQMAQKAREEAARERKKP